MPTPQPIRLFDPQSNQTNGWVIRTAEPADLLGRHVWWHGGAAWGPIDWGVITPVYATEQKALDAYADEGSDRPAIAVTLGAGIAEHYATETPRPKRHGTETVRLRRRRLPRST